MYKCKECDEIFEEPEYETLCMEDYCGVSSMFPDRHYKTVATCPRCGAFVDLETDFYYGDEEDEDDE